MIGRRWMVEVDDGRGVALGQLSQTPSQFYNLRRVSAVACHRASPFRSRTLRHRRRPSQIPCLVYAPVWRLLRFPGYPAIKSRAVRSPDTRIYGCTSSHLTHSRQWRAVPEFVLNVKPNTYDFPETTSFPANGACQSIWLRRICGL